MKFFNPYGILYLLLFSTGSFAQTTIRIVDGSSNSVLPLATLVNLSKNIVRFADEDGNFVFEWNNGDTIKITHIGYYDKIIQLGKITNNTIKLIQNPALLPNVTVTSCTNKVSDNYNNFTLITGYAEFGGMVWNDNIQAAKAAVIIRPSVQDAQLSQLEFQLKKTFLAPKKIKEFPESPIRFSFYSVDPKTKLPSELLTNQTVIYTPKKIGKQVVNVDSLFLGIPDSGLYVGIEYLIGNKYCYPVKFEPSIYTDSVTMQYPLMFDGIRSKGFRMAFYDYRISAWHFANDEDGNELDTVRATIKFGISYTYCNDNKK